MCKNVIGVWHRPNSGEREDTLEGLCGVLDEFQAAGINLVFLESFYHGKVVYRSELIPYSTRLGGFTYGDYPDYLSAFVAEAKKRNIDVHAWVQDFYIGVDEDAELVKKYSDWLLVNQHGGIRHTTEGHGFGGYLFFDPSRDEVRDFLKRAYDELLTKIPDLKGLNLDYIRYPVSDFNENTDTGYTEHSMLGFAKRCGLSLGSDNMREELNSLIREKGLLDEWIAYRAEFISDFVKSIRDMLNDKHPGKLISTAVFPEVNQSYMLKKQNIKLWLDSNYINMATPMVHFYEADKVYEAVKNLKSMCGDISCYTGLYTTYHNQTLTELADHIKASADGGAEGFVLFDSAKTFYEATVDYLGFLSERYGNSN